MHGKSIKSPKALTETYMSKFPVPKLNFSGSRPTPAQHNTTDVQKSPTNEPQITRSPSQDNTSNDRSININSIEQLTLFNNSPTTSTSKNFVETTPIII